MSKDDVFVYNNLHMMGDEVLDERYVKMRIRSSRESARREASEFSKC